jgi:hypothetical protein
MALFNKNGMIEGSEGKTVLVKMENVYLGDGDGYTHGVGIIETAEGYKRVECGASNWYGYDCDLLGSVVDGDVAKFEAYTEEQTRLARIRRDNSEAYELANGRYAIVRKGEGKRKRKNAGRSGFIFWHGQTQYGHSVGIQEDNGERFFVAAYQVAVVPTPEEIGG